MNNATDNEERLIHYNNIINELQDLLYFHYGEERVDIIKKENLLSAPFREGVVTTTIIIYTPELIIKNENNNTHTLYDVYVKLNLNENGILIGNFTITRTTFSNKEIKNNYMHSHICRDDFLKWGDPCLGTNVIKNTIIALNTSFNIDSWAIFLYELDTFLTVESLSGTPYIRMSKLNDVVNEDVLYDYYCKSHALNNFENGFIKYLIEKDILSFYFINDIYYLNYSFEKLKNLISYHLINFYNLYFKDILREDIFINEFFNVTGFTNNSIYDKKVSIIIFKGKKIKLKNLDIENTNYILKNNRLFRIIYKINLILSL